MGFVLFVQLFSDPRTPITGPLMASGVTTTAHLQ